MALTQALKCISNVLQCFVKLLCGNFEPQWFSGVSGSAFCDLVGFCLGVARQIGTLGKPLSEQPFGDAQALWVSWCATPPGRRPTAVGLTTRPSRAQDVHSDERGSSGRLRCRVDPGQGIRPKTTTASASVPSRVSSSTHESWLGPSIG